jgi:uncharacterized protein YhbP (UPF0306 family)
MDFRAEALALLKEHTVMSLATLYEGLPHAASLMFAHDGFDLIWVSDPASRHSQAVAATPEVSVTVANQYDDFKQIRGLQLAGSVVRLDDRYAERQALKLLGDRYSFINVFRLGPKALRDRLAAVAAYRLRTTAVTLIDNRRGFGWKQTFNPD